MEHTAHILHMNMEAPTVARSSLASSSCHRSMSCSIHPCHRSAPVAPRALSACMALQVSPALPCQDSAGFIYWSGHGRKGEDGVSTARGDLKGLGCWGYHPPRIMDLGSFMLAPHLVSPRPAWHIPPPCAFNMFSTCSLCA